MKIIVVNVMLFYKNGLVLLGRVFIWNNVLFVIMVVIFMLVKIFMLILIKFF